MKTVLVFLVALLILPGVAANINVTVVDKGSDVIAELDGYALYDFIIENNGPEDSFEIYSFVGLTFDPLERFNLSTGTNTIEVKAFPSNIIKEGARTHYLEYGIKGRNTPAFKANLFLNVVKLKNAIGIDAQDIEIGADSAIINIENKANTYIKSLDVTLKSSLFEDYSQTISLDSFDSVQLVVPVDAEALRGLSAGRYVITASLEGKDGNVDVSGDVNFVEKSIVDTDVQKTGLLIRKTVVEKANNGNLPAVARVELSTDIIGRLFTIHSEEPLSSERSGLGVKYIWEKQIAPGESYVVEMTTNYTIPSVFLVFIIILVMAVKYYSLKGLEVKKKVSFVRTKSGVFALKVSIGVRARKYVENIQVIDNIPAMTQVYNKFGVQPDRIDSASRKLFWKLEKLDKGEERIYSYIVYSKVKVAGRFELPSATAIYEREGRIHESVSNRVFFVSETTKTDNVF